MGNIETIKSVFENEDVRAKFEEMLGTKASGFIISVINVVSNDSELSKADRNSILFASATAGMLDLPVNPNLGFAYIIPYKGKAQFQMGYKGFIQLAQRSGQFKTISASPVYEGQITSENPLEGYKFDFTKKESDNIIGYAGYFKLLNGFEKTLFMTVDELKRHGKKYSQTYKRGFGLWEDNFDAMATKTVIKLLLSKFAPLSIEMQKAVLADQGTISDWEGEVIDYPDNEVETIMDYDVEELFKENKSLLTEEEIASAERIINNKEKSSYNKLYKLLISKNDKK